VVPCLLLARLYSWVSEGLGSEGLISHPQSSPRRLEGDQNSPIVSGCSPLSRTSPLPLDVEPDPVRRLALDDLAVALLRLGIVRW
jgi:hypothetical protein